MFKFVKSIIAFFTVNARMAEMEKRLSDVETTATRNAYTAERLEEEIKDLRFEIELGNAIRLAEKNDEKVFVVSGFKAVNLGSKVAVEPFKQIVLTKGTESAVKAMFRSGAFKIHGNVKIQQHYPHKGMTLEEAVPNGTEAA